MLLGKSALRPSPQPPDAQALRRTGRLAVADERGYVLLRDLCPAAPGWTSDGF
jgi:hypothetical protein